jgi:hypothetical protein
MSKLIVKQNQLDYVGVFSHPAFSLYGNSSKLLEGVYTTFAPYQVALTDIREDSPYGRPSELALTVSFGRSSFFRLRLDRIEFTVYNFTSEDLQVFPQILRSSDDWLRSMISSFSWDSHFFGSTSHNGLSEGTSREYLRGLSSLDIPGIGISEGSGVIYHWEVPSEDWRVQLLIDHSTSVPSGLFINFILRPTPDKIDYEQVTLKGFDLFKRALASIGLEVTDNA